MRKRLRKILKKDLNFILKRNRPNSRPPHVQIAGHRSRSRPLPFPNRSGIPPNPHIPFWRAKTRFISMVTYTRNIPVTLQSHPTALFFKLFIPCSIAVFPNFQPTNTHNCHVIHNNIFKNIRLLHVSDRTGPSSGNINSWYTKQLINNILTCCLHRKISGILPCRLNKWYHEYLQYIHTLLQLIV